MTSDYTASNPGFPVSYEELTDADGWVPLNKRESLSIAHICAICSSMLAFQVGYAIEFGLFGPIMDTLSPLLGLKKIHQTFIWLVPPLCGFIVQPLIGYASDGCKFKYGRRRLFIVIGAIGIFAGFLALNFLEQACKYFIKVSGRGLANTYLVILFIFINVSINILQGPARSIVGDVVPSSQQVLSNTIGSFMLGLANVFTNAVGGFNLGNKIGLKSNDEFIFIIGMILIVISVVITLFSAKEERFRENLDRANPFKELYIAFSTMPKEVFRISIVYMFSWSAYFTFNNQTTNLFIEVYGENRKEMGKQFGLLVIAVSNLLVLVYSPFQEKLIEKVGMKWAYAISQLVEAAFLIPVFFVKNRWALMALLAPLGMASSVFNSIPFAVVGVIVSKEKMGLYMGALNSFAVIGQEISTLTCQTALTAVIKAAGKTPKIAPTIASGSFFAVIAAICSAWIVVPTQDKEMLTPLNHD